MSESKNKKLSAKEIAELSLKRRREAQYGQLLAWKNGEITGKQCIERIEDLSKIIEVKPEDFNSNKKK